MRACEREREREREREDGRALQCTVETNAYRWKKERVEKRKRAWNDRLVRRGGEKASGEKERARTREKERTRREGRRTSVNDGEGEGEWPSWVGRRGGKGEREARPIRMQWGSESARRCWWLLVVLRLLGRVSVNGV
ncbi:hypothetical protein ALC60_07443 [Trachymyrmex zeteki]|uniref:Uncharacterized protein n=1 Tax=Mycetomoellerius zeteki TaxID=64791 RepID=A0A151X067_9HYME|nr:hypothetical protein ALC60_07443 [Trachymyrmex zeteki]